MRRKELPILSAPVQGQYGGGLCTGMQGGEETGRVPIVLSPYVPSSLQETGTIRK